eukprot:1751473-Prorocentrum_lima.AAC.1
MPLQSSFLSMASSFSVNIVGKLHVVPEGWCAMLVMLLSVLRTSEKKRVRKFQSSLPTSLQFNICRYTKTGAG